MSLPEYDDCDPQEEYVTNWKIDEEELGFLSDEEYNRRVFADPGNPNSSLRAGYRCHPCPTCGTEDALTSEDVRLGYQCNRCADGGY